MRSIPVPWMWICLPLVLAAGCGPKGPARFKVAGAVRWNGDLVPAGDIIFKPINGKARAEAAKIVAGRYSLWLEAGPAAIEIYASRDTGQVDAAMNSSVLEHYIPAEFNTQTRLKREIEPRNDNTLDFDLKPGGSP